MSTLTQREKARRAARRFWAGLDVDARNELGDQLVLGGMDWRDWLDTPPSPGFWSAVDDCRINWECAR